MQALLYNSIFARHFFQNLFTADQALIARAAFTSRDEDVALRFHPLRHNTKDLCVRDFPLLCWRYIKRHRLADFTSIRASFLTE